MQMPLWILKLVVIVGLFSLTVYGIRFYHRQAAGALGGPISKPKVFWLCCALFFWFIFSPIVAMDDRMPMIVRAPMSVLAISMWIRGMVEIYMLYVTKTWRPPLGIAHNVLTAMSILLACLWSYRLNESFYFVGQDSILINFNLYTLAPYLPLWALMTLAIECYHAWSFFKVVGPRTMGVNSIWFADEHDSRFATINFHTRIGNMIIGVPLSIFLILWLM
jgi:hypothetical protein